MKNYKRRKRLIPAVFAVLLLLMAAGTCLFAWEVRQDYEEGLKSMIGRLYEEDQESAEQMMGWLFEGERGGAVEKGEEALTALGYTDKGAEYLYEQSRLYTFSAGMVCVEILAGIALLILFVWMERLREEREEELVQPAAENSRRKRRMADRSLTGRRSRRNRSRLWSMRSRSCSSVWRRKSITCRKRIS